MKGFLGITTAGLLAGVVGAGLLMTTFALFPQVNFIARIRPVARPRMAA